MINNIIVINLKYQSYLSNSSDQYDNYLNNKSILSFRLISREQLLGRLNINGEKEKKKKEEEREGEIMHRYIKAKIV